MAETKHTLEIVTKTEDLASRQLQQVGAEGQKAGKRIAKGMAGAALDFGFIPESPALGSLRRSPMKSGTSTPPSFAALMEPASTCTP